MGHWRFVVAVTLSGLWSRRCWWFRWFFILAKLLLGVVACARCSEVITNRRVKAVSMMCSSARAIFRF